MARTKLAVTVRALPIKTIPSHKTAIPFQNSKRYKDMVELAENMHNFAKLHSNGNVRASAVQMFAHHLLLIAHKQYRRNRK
jgi:hypothetical protein